MPLLVGFMVQAHEQPCVFFFDRRRNAMHILSRLVPCFVTVGFFFAGSTAHAQRKQDPKEVAAIAEIQKLGGKVELDEERPGHPAIKVDLRKTKVTDKNLEHVKQLRHLQVLYVNNTDIGDEGVAHLVGLTDLHTLSIHGTKMTDKSLAGLTKMPRLRVLIVCGNPITDEGLYQLRTMANLKELYLYGTNVTAEGAEKLRKQLHETHIEGK
jgi:Leucine Rich repeat